MPRSQAPHPFWGLNFSIHPDAHILVIDDDSTRKPILAALTNNHHTVWAMTPQEVQLALDEHGPFDVYFLDYDYEDTVGGWWDTAKFVRQTDPQSIGKII